MKIEQEAFAAISMAGEKPYIMSWTVAGNAATVRERVGKAWDKDDPTTGWKAARIEGVKVRKVTLVFDHQ